MKIFDVHTHVFPDSIAEGAIAHLREKSGNIPAYTDGTLSDLSTKATEAGYSGWMNCPVVTSARQMSSINDKVAATNRWPHLSMGGIFPAADLADVLAAVQKIKDLGLLGIKLHPEYQDFSPLDERLSPVWELCASLELPVLFHAGMDIGFPGQEHSMPGDFAKLSIRFPNLVIICAHMGGWGDWDRVYSDLAGSNVYLDTSFSLPWMKSPEMFEKIIRKHGASRILFGTDSPWQELTAGIQEITSTSLSFQEKEDIFWNNSFNVFHLERFISE